MEDEDWTPAKCTAENSDSSDDEDLPDESVEETNAEVEGPTTTQETTTKKPARAKVKRKDYQWKKTKQFEPPNAGFEWNEKDTEDRLDWTP